jgi:fructose-1,6-bisphosphatase I
VSDFHRNLLKGGVYIYPAELNEPLGKIRLMYEAQALAFIAEQAGGYGSDGHCNLLEIEPQSLHQRSPIFIGNRELVKEAEAIIADYKTF